MPVSIQMAQCWDRNILGSGGIQEVAVWIVGPNSQSGYGNLVSTTWNDWYYTTLADFQSGRNLAGPLPTSWNRSGLSVVNGRHYVYVRVMDDDDTDGLINGQNRQPLYTVLVTYIDVTGGVPPPPTPTPLPTAVPTPTPTLRPTHTPVPTRTPTLTPTWGPSPTPTSTSTPTSTPTPTNTPIVTPTPSPTTTPVTPTPTNTPTNTPVPTLPGGGD